MKAPNSRPEADPGEEADRSAGRGRPTGSPSAVSTNQGAAESPEAYTANFSVVRALLRRGQTYERAVKLLEPYDWNREPSESAREGMTEIIRRSRATKKPTFLFVNNRVPR